MLSLNLRSICREIWLVNWLPTEIQVKRKSIKYQHFPKNPEIGILRHPEFQSRFHCSENHYPQLPQYHHPHHRAPSSLNSIITKVPAPSIPSPSHRHPQRYRVLPLVCYKQQWIVSVRRFNGGPSFLNVTTLSSTLVEVETLWRSLQLTFYISSNNSRNVHYVEKENTNRYSDRCTRTEENKHLAYFTPRTLFLNTNN